MCCWWLTNKSVRPSVVYSLFDVVNTPCPFPFLSDDTDNINQVIGSNSPESCLSYLTDLEKKRDPVLDQNHLTRLIDFYTRVFSNMPLGKHCHNESYARMLVRFAELKAWVDVIFQAIWKKHRHSFEFFIFYFTTTNGNIFFHLTVMQNLMMIFPKKCIEILWLLTSW